MKQVITKHFPPGGFIALTLFPFIFTNRKLDGSDLVHEEIHGRQQVELLYVGFLIAYLLCWLKELVHCLFDTERGQIITQGYKKRNYWHRVEHSIIFEREAYGMQGFADYLDGRRWWAWRGF